MKKHNFYAGPSILSEYTIKNTADAILNFADTGLSVLEVSHRSKEFQAVIDEASALVKRNSRSSCRIRSTLAWRWRIASVRHDSLQPPRQESRLSRHRNMGL